MDNYIAYHSSEVMGRPYGTPKKNFTFHSAKPQSFLDRAIGQHVWIITGSRDTSRKTIYHLAGMFKPTKVSSEGDGFCVSGGGVSLRPIDVTVLPWFADLLLEQNNFSFGFNKIHSKVVVNHLQKLLQNDERARNKSVRKALKTKRHPSTNEFEQILLDKAISKLQLKTMQALYNYPNHAATAGQLAKTLGFKDHLHANSAIGNAGKRIANLLGLIPPYASSNYEHFYSVLVDGSYLENNLFLWTMRKELVSALEKTGLVDPSLKVDLAFNKHSHFPKPYKGTKLSTSAIYTIATPENILKASKDGMPLHENRSDLPPKNRTMTMMRFPDNLPFRRSHHEEALHRRTDHQSHTRARGRSQS